MTVDFRHEKNKNRQNLPS